MTYPSKGIVMRSPVRVVPTGDVFWEYYIVSEPMKRRKVARQQAEEYIEENGLVEALDCEHGTIWDTPDRDFQKQYKGFVKDHYIDFMHLWR